MAAAFPIRSVPDALRILRGHGYAVEGVAPRWRVTLTARKVIEVRRGELLLMAEAVRGGQGLDKWGRPQIKRREKVRPRT
jgi:hypothetical protein